MKHIIQLLTFILSSVIGYSQGLVGDYPFNGNANDVSGNGNNGTVSNATLTNDRYGNPNSAYLFNGLNSYINLGTAFSFGDHSFGCWARRDSTTGNVLVSKISNGSYDVKNSEFSINGFLVGNGNSWDILNYNDTVIDYAQWNCFFVTYNSTTKKLKFYSDGKVDSLTGSGYVDVVNTPIYIGARPFWNGTGGTAFHFKGAIDDVKIFSKELTSQEVDSICSILTSVNSYDHIQIRAYPNPTSELLNVICPYTNYHLELINPFGQVVLRKTNINGSQNINIKDISKGTYFLRIIPASGSTKVLKVLKY